MSEYIVDFGGSMAMLARIIESQSANLREEIVRCRDCKHFTPADKEHNNNDWCAKHEHIGWSYGGFCAWAIRRDA